MPEGIRAVEEAKMREYVNQILASGNIDFNLAMAAGLLKRTAPKNAEDLFIKVESYKEDIPVVEGEVQEVVRRVFDWIASVDMIPTGEHYDFLANAFLTFDRLCAGAHYLNKMVNDLDTEARSLVVVINLFPKTYGCVKGLAHLILDNIPPQEGDPSLIVWRALAAL